MTAVCGYGLRPSAIAMVVDVVRAVAAWYEGGEDNDFQDDVAQAIMDDIGKQQANMHGRVLLL